MGLRVCLLLGYLLAVVEAFRTPFGTQNALSNALSKGGQRGSYIIMHASGRPSSTESTEKHFTCSLYTSRAVISRRAIGQLALSTALVTLRGKTASAEFPKISSLTKEEIDSWVKLDGDSGLRLKEISAGLGAETKDGDRLRLRYTVYTLDGTIVSRGQGVEQEFTLGKGQVPVGLENGVRGMHAGAERLLYIPAAIGWASKFRNAALTQIKSCGATCPFETEAVIVFAKLEAYKKAECRGGDMPMQLNADLSVGQISVTIGSEACPEGDIEVTEKRLKTLDMLNKMKQTGKLKAEEKQPFIIP